MTGETWLRSIRGWQKTPGPWHLLPRPRRPWSSESVCGVFPTYRHQRRESRPDDGDKVCRACLNAAEAPAPAPVVAAVPADPNEKD